MPLEEKKYDIESNNDWAKNVKGEHIFIDNAVSGRKGYYCIGCDKQMEAVIKKNPNHRSYFRHVPVDIAKDDKPCTFSNREYRETLATDILQRIKSIKVPNIYKYPPKGIDGIPMLLEKTKFVTASKVKSQLTFYEDSNGEIKYGKHPEVEDRYLLIRPDVTFFDANDNPILLIELVITHKVTEEKKIKLRHLGIDTVSIILPKSSAQDIEDNFKTTKRVKWEYNGIEANTKYIPVSSGTSEGILELDEDQRRIFEESLTCRKARLNNTLRTIRKCLQSEPYRRAEHNFESEISRIEKATNRARAKLEAMEEECEREIREELAGTLQSIETQEREFSREEINFQEYNTNLEKRYYDKIKEVREEQNAINALKKEELEQNRDEREIKQEFGRKEDDAQQNFENRRKKIARDIEFEKTRIKHIQENGRKLPSKFEQLERTERENFERAKTELKEQEKSLEKTVREEFGREIRSDSSKLAKGVRNILEAQRMGNDFQDAKRKEQFYTAARELFNKGTWKKW